MISIVPRYGRSRVTHFLKGVVTGREWLKLGFITNGFNRICGPSEDRLGREVIGGGAADGMTGVGEDTGIGGTGVWLCMGDWYISCGEDIRNGLSGVGGTEDIGDIGVAIPKAGSAIKLGMDIKCGLTSKERAP